MYIKSAHPESITRSYSCPLPSIPEGETRCKRIRYEDYKQLGHIPRTMNFQDLRKVLEDGYKSQQAQLFNELKNDSNRTG